MNMTPKPEHGGPEPDISRPAIVKDEHILVSSGRTWTQRLAMARADLAKTISLWPLVWTLSIFDIRLRYRGSVLGPLWLTLSTAVMVGALGFLYSRLFHTDITTYLPFLSLSLVLWQFISTLTTEGCICFTMQETMIRAMRMPLSLHAARVVLRNVLVLGHNIVVIAVVFLIMGTVPGKLSFLIIPAFALWLIDGFAICLMLGMLCARYRDVPPIVASVMQIAFFISPVMWSPTVLAHRGIGLLLIQWNPFYALLDIMRAPLLSTPVTVSTWLLALIYSFMIVLLATLIFIRSRARVAYWV